MKRKGISLDRISRQVIAFVGAIHIPIFLGMGLPGKVGEFLQRNFRAVPGLSLGRNLLARKIELCGGMKQPRVDKRRRERFATSEWKK